MEIFKGIKPECFAALNQLMLNNGCKITEYTKRQKSDIYPEKKQDFCTAMQSDVCKNLFDTNLIDLPECKNSKKNGVLYLELMLKLGYYKYFNRYCIYDENGNECPFSEKNDVKYMINTANNGYRNLVLEDACKPQKCVDTLYYYKNELIELAKMFNEELDKTNDITSQDKSILKFHYENIIDFYQQNQDQS